MTYYGLDPVWYSNISFIISFITAFSYRHVVPTELNVGSEPPVSCLMIIIV
jgi:hypothetical protein